jgi:hypothetical protein
MNHTQNTRTVLSISPGVAGVNSAATHTVAIDCLGFDALSIDVAYRSLANTSAPSVLGLRFADADAATSYATVSGLVQGTDYTVAAVSNTAVVNITRFELGSTKALPRFVQVRVTPSADATANGTNNDVVVAARLHKGEVGIDNATDANVTTRVVYGG